MEAIHVTDRPANTPTVSRRMWLAGLAGGLLSVPFLWWFEMPPRTRTAEFSRQMEGAYVDRDGWMLTPEDAAALAARSAVQ